MSVKILKLNNVTKIDVLEHDILVNIVVEINRRISYYNIRRFYMHFTSSIAPSAINDREERGFLLIQLH